MRFVGSATPGATDGAQITRVMDLSAANTATITYSADPASLESGESVTVYFAANGTDFVPLQAITGNGNSVNYTHTVMGPFAANAAIRFVATAFNETNDIAVIDNLAISFRGSRPSTAALGTIPMCSRSATVSTSSTK